MEIESTFGHCRPFTGDFDQVKSHESLAEGNVEYGLGFSRWAITRKHRAANAAEWTAFTTKYPGCPWTHGQVIAGMEKVWREYRAEREQAARRFQAIERGKQVRASKADQVKERRKQHNQYRSAMCEWRRANAPEGCSLASHEQAVAAIGSFEEWVSK